MALALAQIGDGAMPDDPALTYRGVESTSQDILVVLFSGAAVTVRGVLVNFETSAGEASAPFADSGPVAWIALGRRSGST